MLWNKRTFPKEFEIIIAKNFRESLIEEVSVLEQKQIQWEILNTDMHFFYSVKYNKKEIKEWESPKN